MMVCSQIRSKNLKRKKRKLRIKFISKDMNSSNLLNRFVKTFGIW